MSRRHRIVVAGKPHHVIQRGNRRQQVFFYPGDKSLYLKLLKEQVDKHGVEVWAYCLMDNHVHLVLVPKEVEGFSKAVAETNRSFTCKINKRYGWKGYLWQGRFISFVMDDLYLARTMRYVENNPVRAQMVGKAWDYPWSSARKHATDQDDALLSECPLVESKSKWCDFLMNSESEEILDKIRKRNLSGLPLGDKGFIEKMAEDHGLNPTDLLPKPMGRPKKI